MPQPVYTPEVMADRVVKGDVGEGLFRLLAEERLELQNTRIDQFGYNPSGVVSTEDPEKRALLEWSGPDFALVRGDQPQDPKQAAPLAGISINTQAQFYSCHSTRGQGCRGCPWFESCYAGHENRIWYNFYNVANDYRRFYERYGVDTLMVTLFFTWRNTVAGYVKRKEERLDALKRYIVGGVSAAEADPQVSSIRDYLTRGGRAGVDRSYQLRWFRWSDIVGGGVDWWGTFGFSQSPTLPLKVCIEYSLAHPEEELWDELGRLDAAGEPLTIAKPSQDVLEGHRKRLEELRFVVRPLGKENLRPLDIAH